MASSAALARPTMPATFSVPARWRRSWLPPTSSDSNGVPRRTNMAPIPLGPCILWALMENRWQPKRRTSNGTLPAPCTASMWKKAPAVRAILADFFDGLQDAGLVVGQHHADQAGLGPDGAQNVRRIDEAAGLRRDEGGFDADGGEALAACRIAECSMEVVMK